MSEKIKIKSNVSTEASTIPSESFQAQVYITLDQEELTLLGLPRELWGDSEAVCDAIHSLMYELYKHEP